MTHQWHSAPLRSQPGWVECRGHCVPQFLSGIAVQSRPEPVALMEAIVDHVIDHFDSALEQQKPLAMFVDGQLAALASGILRRMRSVLRIHGLTRVPVVRQQRSH